MYLSDSYDNVYKFLREFNSFSYRRPKNVIATPLKNGGSNLVALGIAGGTVRADAGLPVILMDRRERLKAGQNDSQPAPTI